MLGAVKAGRRVLTNIDGINPDAINAYLLARMGPTDDASKLGEVLTFHGDQMLKPGFFPDETTGDAETFVKPGDLLVIDEWALYFRARGKWPEGCNVEPFLRWHRHLTGKDGQATDVVIATQLPTDLHNSIRGLVQTTYKFRKLTALGAEGTYAYQVFQGHLTPKGGAFKVATGKYDPEVFPLYASSSAAKEGTHVELKTNKRDSIKGTWQWWAVVAGAPLLLVVGAVLLWVAWAGIGGDAPVPAVAGEAGSVAAAGAPATGAAPAPVAKSVWRIVGTVDGEFGRRVVVADKAGTTRLMLPGDFQFDEGRPVSGTVDGERATAEDRLPEGESQAFGVELGQ